MAARLTGPSGRQRRRPSRTPGTPAPDRRRWPYAGECPWRDGRYRLQNLPCGPLLSGHGLSGAGLDVGDVYGNLDLDGIGERDDIRSWKWPDRPRSGLILATWGFQGRFRPGGTSPLLERYIVVPRWVWAAGTSACFERYILYHREARGLAGQPPPGRGWPQPRPADGGDEVGDQHGRRQWRPRWRWSWMPAGRLRLNPVALAGALCLRLRQ